MVRKFKISAVFILMLFGSISVWGQTTDIPGESIFTHLSEQCLFPGEQLWLTIYVSNHDDLPGKQISNLAFVEFVDNRNTSLIRKKVLLKKGIGNCAFAIPDSLSTGIYTIMVYTKWSKNFGENSFNKTKVLVFNPNTPAEETIQNSESHSVTSDASVNNGPGIRTNKATYSIREKVIVELDFGNLNFDSANISISAKQKEPVQIRELTKEIPPETERKTQNITYYPDYKGILLSGKILNKINNLPVSNEEIVLSFPGNYVEIKYAKTNSEGEFNFLLEPKTGEQDLVFNLPSDDCLVKLDDPFVNGFDQTLEQKTFKITDLTFEYLKDRFVRNQLMKRFGQVNVENTVKVEEFQHSDFFGEAYQTVKFEDYKKLDSISEYFYELIPTAHFSNKQGEQQLYITNPETNFKLGENPVVFIDGVYYPGLKELASIDHNQVKEINVVPKVYYYRDKIYDGIVSLKTISNNFNQVKQLDNMVRIIYPVSDVCPSFKLYNPDVDGKEQHAPDIRTLLLWGSNLLYEKEKPEAITFYTSDIKGEFVISVAGITDTGEFIRMEKTINVASE